MILDKNFRSACRRMECVWNVFPGLCLSWVLWLGISVCKGCVKIEMGRETGTNREREREEEAKKIHPEKYLATPTFCRRSTFDSSRIRWYCVLDLHRNQRQTNVMYGEGEDPEWEKNRPGEIERREGEKGRVPKIESNIKWVTHTSKKANRISSEEERKKFCTKENHRKQRKRMRISWRKICVIFH